MDLTINNAADWHATMALKAYRKREWDVFKRHIHIADNLRQFGTTGLPMSVRLR